MQGSCALRTPSDVTDEDVLGGERADYGKRVVARLADQLTGRYGPGFSRVNLTMMLRFAAIYPVFEIVQTLSEQLTWSHIQVLLSIDDPLEREFYEILVAREHWSVRTLRRHVQRLLFRRTVATSG